MRRQFFGSAFFSVILAASAPAQTTPPARVSDGVVKIGVLTDMSGLFADLGGQGSFVAARMAVDDFGGTVLGAEIKVVAADHQNKPDIASAIVREWFDRQQVDVITDLVGSAVAIASSKIADAKNKLAVVIGAASTRITNEDCNSHTIHYASDTYALANGTAREIIKSGGGSWAFVTADYAFGHSLEADASNAVTAAGGKVLAKIRHPLNASDFSSFMVQAQSSGAKIVALANAGGDTINAIKSANEFGLTPSQTLAALLIYITDVHSVGLEKTQGMLLTEAFYWDMDDNTRAFSKRFFEAMNRMPTLIHAGVYSSTMNYLKAVRETGTDDADKVMKHLKTMNLDDFYVQNGKLRDDGRLIKDLYLMQVKSPQESKYPWDYYKLKSVIPASEAFQPLALSRCALIKK